MKLYRQSGNPINPAHIELKHKALNAAMDHLEETLGKCTQETAPQFQVALEGVHNELLNEFPICIEMAFPKSKRGMQAFCRQMGSVGFCIEDGKLVAYILDV